jgi:hypothetical protein
MPLRDHFRPPVSERASWEGLHGQWPAMLVLQLARLLPPQYMAEPRVHVGSEIEVDRGTFADDSANPSSADDNGLQREAAEPSLAVETELLDTSEYEVRVFDTRKDRRLVAAIELVSPANKDRPETRGGFVFKCKELLRWDVCVMIVDVVTVRQFNLYADLLSLIHQRDASQGNPPSPIYAASCRWVPRGRKRVLETWSRVLTVGQPLPPLPLWLTEERNVSLNLETSYEETCLARMILQRASKWASALLRGVVFF